MEIVFWIFGSIVYLVGGAYTFFASLRYTAWDGGDYGLAVGSALFWPIALPTMWACVRDAGNREIPRIARHRMFDRWEI